MGGGIPSDLAASPRSHAHTAQAWRNTERANSSAVLGSLPTRVSLAWVRGGGRPASTRSALMVAALAANSEQGRKVCTVYPCRTSVTTCTTDGVRGVDPKPNRTGGATEASRPWSTPSQITRAPTIRCRSRGA